MQSPAWTDIEEYRKDVRMAGASMAGCAALLGVGIVVTQSWKRDMRRRGALWWTATAAQTLAALKATAQCIGCASLFYLTERMEFGSRERLYFGPYVTVLVGPQQRNKCTDGLIHPHTEPPLIMTTPWILGNRVVQETERRARGK